MTFAVCLFIALVVDAGRPCGACSRRSPAGQARAGRHAHAAGRVLADQQAPDAPRASEDAALGGYGRADPGTKDGPVRIPIDRAIDLIAERGLPQAGGRARTEVEVNSHAGESAARRRAKRKAPEAGAATRPGRAREGTQEDDPSNRHAPRCLRCRPSRRPCRSPRRPAPQEVKGPEVGLLRKVAFDQNLDAQVPLDAPLRDETGRGQGRRLSARGR